MKDDKSSDNRLKRDQMVREQIESRGIRDKRVLEAMRRVPRELFVRQSDLPYAFHDGPLSIGYGQTISQPYIVAYMTEMLSIKSNDRVLEIGTGSGYQTAVLAELAAQVFTIEIVEELAREAQERLASLGYRNIRFRTGDGSLGWPEEAPFDAIIITAAPDRTPDKLVEQLAEGGRMIVPVGAFDQNLELVEKKGPRIETHRLIGVRFVPMVGEIRRKK